MKYYMIMLLLAKKLKKGYKHGWGHMGELFP